MQKLRLKLYKCWHRCTFVGHETRRGGGEVFKGVGNRVRVHGTGLQEEELAEGGKRLGGGVREDMRTE